MGELLPELPPEEARQPIWPGCVTIVGCLGVALLIPSGRWWGKVIFWAATLWGTAAIWYTGAILKSRRSR
jgi:hypothetical protein